MIALNASWITPATGDSNSNQAHHQYLTFMLGEEEYGVDILRVQEIRGWDGATTIPNVPRYVSGVINLRGAILPVIDLRRRLLKEPIAYTVTTVVIIVKVSGGRGERVIGLVVDAVSDVRSIGSDQLRAAPDMADGQKFVKSLATINGDMVILLDVDQLMDVPPQENARKN